jgi:hypothetical protein
MRVLLPTANCQLSFIPLSVEMKGKKRDRTGKLSAGINVGVFKIDSDIL